MRPGVSNRSLSKLVLIGGVLTTLAGCAMKDFVWSQFGNAYSEGGITDYDRNYHYEQRLEESNRAAAADGW